MYRRVISARIAATSALAVIASTTISIHAQSPRSGVAELSLEELATIEVMSVSRGAESLADAAASVFVITADDIRRSTATTLPEVLRLAPHLQVARIDAGQYAITARGFNNLAANKLLVLVDGRTIYTPLFSGVFWDQQAIALEDIERIEVISGPGAALWGANAVNGVINVITRSAHDTQGVVASAGVGNEQQALSFRYGGGFPKDGHYRVYGGTTRFDDTLRPGATATRDGRNWLQAGFRADWGTAARGLTLQGDAHGVESADRGMANGVPIGRAELSGQNLLAHWRGRVGDRSELRVQAYVDHANRDERVLFQPASTLFDVEIQHSLSRGVHDVAWGTGYRHGRDDVEDGFLVGFRPTRRRLNWSQLYVRDGIGLTERLKLTLGIRIDRNDYTGWEHQPDARIGWKLSADHLVWGAVSRAVRAPARFDRDVIRPLGGVFGGPDFVSETADVVQFGYRARAAGVLSWSMAAFVHRWDRLRSATALPVFFENKIEGPVYGGEGWAAWQPLPRWRLTGGFATLRKELRLQPGSTDPQGPRNPLYSSDPGGQWTLRSSFTAWTIHEVDAMIRRVGALANPVVPAYAALDARYGWRIHRDLEMEVSVQNLFGAGHPEFNAVPNRSQFERALFLNATWMR